MKITPRSIRNNNPGNLDHNPANKWVGVLPPSERNGDQRAETRFEVFRSLAYGFRATAVLLQSYQDKHGLRTIRGLIARWAPPHENDTLAYIDAVCSKVGVGPDNEVDVHQYSVMRPLVEAIAVHETGYDPATGKPWRFNPADIDEGLRRAGIVKPVTAATHAKPAVAATVVGGLGLSQVSDVLPAVANAMNQADAHISSGSWVRIAFGVATVLVAAGIAWSQLKKARAAA